MKNKFIIMFFLGMIFGLYADETKSMTIREIGERDINWYSITINTHSLEQGLQLEGRHFFYRYAVDESTFDEIIGFINNNKELFGERKLYQGFNEYAAGPYGSVELFIDNKGMKYYLYLIERKTSAMFFYELLELFANKGNYKEIAVRLEQSIKHFGFDLLFNNLKVDETKSMTIREIGERNITWYSIIINTHFLEQGLQLEGRHYFYRCAVDESTFDEIIDFINNNKELFGERKLSPPFFDKYAPCPYGSVELFIDNNGMKYYLYLIERKTSAVFFYELLELFTNKGAYKEIAVELEQSIKYFGFDLLLNNLKASKTKDK